MSTLPDAENPGRHYVYRCYDAEGTLLYVGCTDDVEGRMYHLTHLCNAGKQPNGTLRRHMARYTTTEHPTRIDARRAERLAVSTEGPLLNKQHNPTRFRKVKGGRYEPVAPIHPLTAAAFDLAATA